MTMRNRAFRKALRLLHSECWYFRERIRAEMNDADFEPTQEQYETALMSRYNNIENPNLQHHLALIVDTVRKNIPPKTLD